MINFGMLDVYSAFVLGAALGGGAGVLLGRWSLLLLMRPRRRR